MIYCHTNYNHYYVINMFILYTKQQNGVVRSRTKDKHKALSNN